MLFFDLIDLLVFFAGGLIGAMLVCAWEGFKDE